MDTANTTMNLQLIQSNFEQLKTFKPITNIYSIFILL
jgi:hypothetical protein